MEAPAERDGPPDGFDAESLRRRFAEAGQGHVFRWYDDLDAPGRARLAASAAAVDLRVVARLALARGLAPPPPAPEPLGEERIAREALVASGERREAAIAEGDRLLREGRLGLVTVAGGQGTRLGYPGPKGCFPIGPWGRTLFDYHAEAVAAASERAGRAIPWVLLVSPATERATRTHLRRGGLPGIPAAAVRVCCQATLPVLDDDGHLLLERKDRIAVAPDGHGGLLRALRDSGSLAWLATLGVEELSCFQVDNPLAPPADPLFLGLHRLARAQMSSKVFPKADPDERVGVVVRLDGRPGVIEYSELSPVLARARLADGSLAYGDANMAAHVLALPFVAAVAFTGLPLHRARKIVPHIDAAGRRTVPAAPNAWKFETFLFDALRRAERGIVLEVSRAAEFAPVKNATGTDSPDTCRALLKAAGRWRE